MLVVLHVTDGAMASRKIHLVKESNFVVSHVAKKRVASLNRYLIFFVLFNSLFEKIGSSIIILFF